MIMFIKKQFAKSQAVLHTVFWTLYTIAVYVYNVVRDSETTFLQCLGGIPLIMTVFYLSYCYLRSGENRFARIWLVLLFIPIAFLFFLICDYWIYHLLPRLTIHISNYDDRDHIEFGLNYLQYLIKYILYGGLFALLERVKMINILEARLLLKSVDPHHNFNAWNGVLIRLKGDTKSLLSYIQAQVSLQRYASKISKQVNDIIPFEMELAKMKTMVNTLKENVKIDVQGLANGQLILPMAGIELLCNALKYCRPDSTIYVVFILGDGLLTLSMQNEVLINTGEAGLGTGIGDIRKRITLNPFLTGDIHHACINGVFTINLILKNK